MYTEIPGVQEVVTYKLSASSSLMKDFYERATTTKDRYAIISSLRRLLNSVTFTSVKYTARFRNAEKTCESIMPICNEIPIKSISSQTRRK